MEFNIQVNGLSLTLEEAMELYHILKNLFDHSVYQVPKICSIYDEDFISRD